MRHRRFADLDDQRIDDEPKYLDDEEGARCAAALQAEYGTVVFVLWEVGGRHLTAWYQGPTPKGLYVKGRTKQDLRERVSAMLGELRLATSIPMQHPIVNDILPGLRRGRG
ncbi:hypothetical protein [Nonomuraea helvata]|uniref:Uncharacterized protein n=1 Tax=Nonomuraea helvata TaxID=37484 RepID=A0ABV5S764_9ACTN